VSTSASDQTFPTGFGVPAPRSIRDALLPREAGDFDREYRAAMAQATESLDLTGVVQVLQRWQRVAASTVADPARHQQMLDHADRLSTAQTVPTESWPVTRARLGL
jgi:hypothetical protein